MPEAESEGLAQPRHLLLLSSWPYVHEMDLSVSTLPCWGKKASAWREKKGISSYLRTAFFIWPPLNMLSETIRVERERPK